MVLRHKFLFLALAALMSAALSCSSNGGSIRIESYTGDVTVNGAELPKNRAVEDGSTVRTGPASTCDIVFLGRNIVRLEENTEIRFSLASNRQIELKTGGLGAVLKGLKARPGQNSAIFEVESEVAVASVRGTALYMHTEHDETYLCLCNGRLEMGDVLGISNFSVTAEHHKAFFFNAGAYGTQVSNGGLVYHTDEAIEKTAAKIGYKLDWKKADLSY